ALALGPVLRGRRKHGRAPRGLRGAVEGVGGGAPRGVVRHRAMRLECGLILVDLEEVIHVRVLLVLEHVEAVTRRFVALGAERIDLDGFQEALALLGLDPRLHPHRDHGGPLSWDGAPWKGFPPGYYMTP